MNYLLTLLAAILVVALVATVQAAGIEYSGSTKPVICQNPTANTDGSQVTEVIKATVYIDKVAGQTPSEFKFDITGGCRAGVTFDLTQLDPGVQYYQYGDVTTAGGVSDLSNSLPFTRALSRPLPPTMVE